MKLVLSCYMISCTKVAVFLIKLLLCFTLATLINDMLPYNVGTVHLKQKWQQRRTVKVARLVTAKRVSKEFLNPKEHSISGPGRCIVSNQEAKKKDDSPNYIYPSQMLLSPNIQVALCKIFF